MTYISAKSVAQNNTYRSYTSGHYGTLNNQEDRFHINFEENLSFGIFSRLIRRKKQFVYQRDIPDTSYLCEACENAVMMAKVIRKKKILSSDKSDDIVEKHLRDSDDPKCMKNICETSQPAKISQSWDADSLSWLLFVKKRVFRSTISGRRPLSYRN